MWRTRDNSTAEYEWRGTDLSSPSPALSHSSTTLHYYFPTLKAISLSAFALQFVVRARLLVTCSWLFVQVGDWMHQRRRSVRASIGSSGEKLPDMSS